MIPDREKYPLPEGMYWDDQCGELGPGAKDNEKDWWHAWVDIGIGRPTVYFDRATDNLDGADPQAPKQPTVCDTEEEAYAYLSAMLMMGFR